MTLDKLAISVEGKELALIDGMALDGGSTLTRDGKGVNSGELHRQQPQAAGAGYGQRQTHAESR